MKILDKSDFPIDLNGIKSLTAKPGQVTVKLKTDSDIIVREGSK